ncbi:hypothetical protein [Saccharomonospora iraqiensis]|uniref:hypothetical protein n=1 Tax=Saccharomonospora iraqiensis TaxID=52698 RepID=UPI00022E0746|nr:hypothetical protein [Saccharomonospora iraqiensis]
MNARDKLLREVVWQAAQHGHAVMVERSESRDWLRINDAKVQVYATAIRDKQSDTWLFDKNSLMEDTDHVILVDRRRPDGDAPEHSWKYYIVPAESLRREIDSEWTVHRGRYKAATGRDKPEHQTGPVGVGLAPVVRAGFGAWSRLKPPEPERDVFAEARGW